MSPDAAPQTPVPTVSVMPKEPRRPPSPGEELGAVLDEAGITRLTLGSAEGACTSERPTWLAAVDGVGCVITDDELRCVATAATDLIDLAYALCGREPAARHEPPAWTTPIAGFVRARRPDAWEVQPVASTPELPALRMRIGDREHGLIRMAGRWRQSIALPDDRWGTPKILRAFDATALAHRPAVALIDEAYDGGSERGAYVTWFDVVCDAPEELRTCGSMAIGSMGWQLDASERHRYPGASSSRQNRPHVEVQLTPTIRFPDRLELTIEISQLTTTLDEDLVAPIQALRNQVGLWRLEDGTFVRVK
jgi:hypothetical protein